MSTLAPSPLGYPLLGATVSGTQISVDVLTNPPSRIPEIVRDLVFDNEGYFIESIFSTPGFTVQGGAVLYTPTFPQTLFLDPAQSLAPRAPGSEAPLVGAKRYAPQIARPESISGRIEVTDEARRRNLVSDVQNAFRLAANTFADRMQLRGITTLYTAVTAWSRTIAGVSWRAAHTSGIMNADPATLPSRDFAKVIQQFIADKAGVRPDTLILHQNDAFYLDQAFINVFGNPGALNSLLARYGIDNVLVTPHATEGTAIFAKSKQVGTIAFEKPLDQEYERAATRKTDVYILEATPVFIAIDASAVLGVTGIN